MKYYGIELHAHTHHSDGDFSMEQLVAEAQRDGYEILTITDHNTMAPYEEWRQQSSRETELLVVPGMEWTTYFGHLLVIGANQVMDWRQAELDTIDERLAEIKAADGLVGIAHPFAIGSPMCTGCHWDFQIEDYEQVDFIEVWNRTKPDESLASQLAYEMWVGLLQRGYHLACSAGRDWHRLEQADENTALTYLGLEALSLAGVKKSLKQGNFYLSLGPQLDLSLMQHERTYYMGERLAVGTGRLSVTLKGTRVKRLQPFDFQGERLVIIQNEQRVAELQLVEDVPQELDLELAAGYLRVELYGKGKGKDNQLLAIANPFYIEERAR